MQNANIPDAGGSDPWADAPVLGEGASADRFAPATQPVRFGVLQGQAWIADDFDAPLPDYLLDAFEGR
ncbi:hypothetical protein [Burkholderia sp. S-53]|uniref:hypothetical protein n=1 Tax=Burkholderia sp. S-53 TaxID=2906514 RepID=UPI0021CE16BC|nr:hypothetical protein [Burkholderia sp. S-53]UXU87622.1 hypothetical protein LXM88_21035 [Burkholderia sp. S-53]